MNENIQNINSINNGQVAHTVMGNQFYVEQLLFQEPIQPLFNCNYYDFKDKFIMLFMTIPIAIAAFNIFYNIAGLALSMYVISAILLLNRIQNILQIINVYNNFFTLNGVIIPFQNIIDLNIRGLGLRIVYKQDALSKNLPTKIAFIKKEEIKKFKEQYNKAKSIIRIPE